MVGTTNIPRSDYHSKYDLGCLDTSSHTFSIDFFNIPVLRSNLQSVKQYLSSIKPYFLFLKPASHLGDFWSRSEWLAWLCCLPKLPRILSRLFWSRSPVGCPYVARMNVLQIQYKGCRYSPKQARDVVLSPRVTPTWTRDQHVLTTQCTRSPRIHHEEPPMCVLVLGLHFPWPARIYYETYTIPLHPPRDVHAVRTTSYNRRPTQ